ncbi:exodeoxyribonuclease VII large subunit [Xylanimonas cellulosilytica]|uniref:exodeoxyribonuclease VII large subunit n=1 Tax=Xylanimonas cellulosilytica TaxID=186189 RepID=UPI00019C0F67|nr:exodeoxyribonuclease VII large subunit [Xylanimonas cellulosilytica]
MTAPASAPLTTPDAPWSVAVVSEKIRGWIARLGDVWVEGQVVQFTERPGSWMQYLTLRDVEAEASLSVKIPSRALATSTARIEKGARVLVHAKPDFWTGNGSFALLADEVRPVGVGELLARIEHLRRILAAEGLFDESRKTRLPFLPHVVGLVTGRNSDAKHDVMKNALLRWPQVRFEVREVAVQGPSAVREVKAAIAELDARPEVEVVVVARGGGALEDLLPFSDESLVRAAAACRTPLVSAIGHEQDCPLLDLVADLRASTPTDAAKRVVPDVAEERRRVEQARRTMRHALRARLDREQHGLDGVRSRPVLARPESMIEHREREIAYRVTHARHVLNAALLRASGEIGRLEAQVRALSPASTLERGYAVVQRPDGHVVRSPDDAAPGTGVRLRLAAGELAATVDG